MTIYKNILYFFLLFVVITFACDSEDDLIDDVKAETPATSDPDPLTGTAGSADFTTYVSFGNSIAAGLMDAALYTRGQESSFPNLMAARFALAGGGTFDQPDINSANGFNTSLNDITNAFDPEAAVFGRFFLDLSIPGPVATTSADPLNFVDDPSSISNLAIPGMRMIELTVEGYGTLNPFYARFTTDPTTQSVLGQGLAKAPTFMTFWLGNNDVLLWASSGGSGPIGIDAMGMPYPTQDATPNALVSTASFDATIDGSMAALFGTNPDLKGVILNIPNITLIPFFQAVTWNAIPLDATTAEVSNAGYAGYNAILDALTDAATFGPLAITQDEADKRKISFTAGDNPIVIVDDQLTDLTTAFDFLTTVPVEMGGITAEQRASLEPLVLARQTKSVVQDPGLATFGLPAEIVTLSAGSLLGTLADPDNPASVIGVGVPLGDQFTLTTDEIGLLLSRITAFNSKIASVADTYPGLVLFDANALFTSIAVNGGIEADGFMYAPDFSPNGIFSTDGIHPNPAGHAIVANQIMDVIESEFGAELPAYDVTDFTTVLSQ